MTTAPRTSGPGRAVIVACLLAVASGASAQTTLYVDGARGDDRVPRASNSAATPWRTLGRAAWGSTDRTRPEAGEAAQAGDTVVVAAGTYAFDGRIGNRWNAVYNPVNQGVEGRPITFRATGVVALTAPQAAAPVIGCHGRSHVVWEGRFTLDEAQIAITPDTGVAVLHDATGCGIDGAAIDGNGPSKWNDNHTGVRVEACRSCFVRRTEIVDVRHPRGSHNGSAVMLYNSTDTLVEQNTISGVDNGVFIKGVFGVDAPQRGTVVRHNLLVDCGECVTVSDSRDARIYQNVIRDARFALNLLAREAGANFHPSGDWFVNNTVLNMSAACVMLGGGDWHERVRLWNNVFARCARVVVRENGRLPAGPDGVDWQHNVYADFGTFAEGPDGRRGFSQWRRDFGHDQAAPASITSAPAFADAAAGDLRPCIGRGTPAPGCRAGSAGLGVGQDLLDLDRDGSTTNAIPAGAYVSGDETIGSTPAGARAGRGPRGAGARP